MHGEEFPQTGEQETRQCFTPSVRTSPSSTVCDALTSGSQWHPSTANDTIASPRERESPAQAGGGLRGLPSPVVRKASVLSPQPSSQKVAFISKRLLLMGGKG